MITKISTNQPVEEVGGQILNVIPTVNSETLSKHTELKMYLHRLRKRL